MPQFDPSTWASQVFWLILLFGLLYWLMATKILPRVAEVLEARQDKIEGDLRRAEALKAEADQALADYEAGVATARAEAHGMVVEANQAFAEQAAKQSAAFDAELAKKVAAAEERIASARANAMASVKSVATEAAGGLVAKLTGIEVEASEIEALMQRAEEAAPSGGSA